MPKITNTAKGVRIVNAKVDGKVVQVPLRPGQTKDLDVIETRVHKARVESGALKVGARAAREMSLKAEHHGGGKFNVTRGEETVLTGLTKVAADAFDAMSDEDQRAYVEASKK